MASEIGSRLGSPSSSSLGGDLPLLSFYCDEDVSPGFPTEVASSSLVNPTDLSLRSMRQVPEGGGVRVARRNMRRVSEGDRVLVARFDLDDEECRSATTSPVTLPTRSLTVRTPAGPTLKELKQLRLQEARAAKAKKLGEDPATQSFVQNWRWGSDHLPNMATINLKGVPVRVLTQNVFDEVNTRMRCPDSLLYEAPGMSTDPIKREALMVSQLLDLLSHFEVVALQECSKNFKVILQEKLKQDHPNWESVFGLLLNESEMVCLYARDYFDLVRTQEFKLESDHQCIQHVGFNFKKTKEPSPVVIINVHIPTGFNRNFSPFASIFCQDEKIPTILLGDMNFSSNEIFTNSFFAGRYKLVSQLVSTTTRRECLTYNCNGIDHVLIGGEGLEGTPIMWVPQLDLMVTYHHMVMYATLSQLEKRKREKVLTEERLIKLTEKQTQDKDSIIETITDLRAYNDFLQKEIDSLERTLDKHRRVQGGVSLSDFDLLR